MPVTVSDTVEGDPVNDVVFGVNIAVSECVPIVSASVDTDAVPLLLMGTVPKSAVVPAVIPSVNFTVPVAVAGSNCQ